MINITIDGRVCPAEERSTILEVAREHDIPIPTLCYNAEVSPGGRCRLCGVEIIAPRRKKPIALACTAHVSEGMEVLTKSEKVDASRKEAMAILLERAPQAEKVQQAAREIGLEVDPSRTGGTGCIVCGICVRVCKEIVGRSAVRFKRGRSSRKEEEISVEAVAERCIGCGTCACLCPTGYIKMEDHGDVRIIWNKVFKRKKHLISGKYYAPEDFIRYLKEAEGIDPARFKDSTAVNRDTQDISNIESCGF